MLQTEVGFTKCNSISTLPCYVFGNELTKFFTLLFKRGPPKIENDIEAANKTRRTVIFFVRHQITHFDYFIAITQEVTCAITPKTRVACAYHIRTRIKARICNCSIIKVKKLEHPTRLEYVTVPEY